MTRAAEKDHGAVKIQPDAFAGCTAPESITLPKTLSQLGNSAFKGCTALETITIQSASPTNNT